VDSGRERTEMLNLPVETRAVKMDVPMLPLAWRWVVGFCFALGEGRRGERRR